MADKILNTGLDALLKGAAELNQKTIKDIDLNQIKPNEDDGFVVAVDLAFTVKGVGESSITPEYKWELIDNEWIPIGRTVKAKSKIKRKNIFVGDMIEAD